MTLCSLTSSSLAQLKMSELVMKGLYNTSKCSKKIDISFQFSKLYKKKNDSNEIKPQNTGIFFFNP